MGYCEFISKYYPSDGILSWSHTDRKRARLRRPWLTSRRVVGRSTSPQQYHIHGTLCPLVMDVCNAKCNARTTRYDMMDRVDSGIVGEHALPPSVPPFAVSIPNQQSACRFSQQVALRIWRGI